jgi:predicted dehydrogenase
VSIGLGLIGVGRHGARYARHLLVDRIEGCHLSVISRRDAAAGRAFAAEHGIAFVPDWRQVLSHPAVDAVVVVTPPALNLPICLAAAEAGKPLLIEKPLALTVADAQTMVSAARHAGVPLMTAQTLRFTPVFRRLKARLPEVGSPQYLSLTMRAEPAPHAWLEDPRQAGGGVVIEIGIHLFDLIRFLTGEEAVEVSAQVMRQHTVHTEDLALVTLRLRSGLRCFVEVSRVAGGRVCRADAMGRDGVLIADVGPSVLTRIKGWTTVEAEAVPDVPTLVTVIREFVRSLTTGSPLPVTGEDGLRAVAMAEAAYRSAAAGGPVPVAV